MGKLPERSHSLYRSSESYRDEFGFPNQGIATGLFFEREKGMSKNEKAGVYFLRTSLDWAGEKAIWVIYNAIREIVYRSEF